MPTAPPLTVAAVRRRAARTRRSPTSRAATSSRACTAGRSPSSIATAACCTPPAIRDVADDDAQRAEAVAGDAVRRRRAASSASATRSAQVALLCASHSGEPRHVAAVADMLAKAGNAADDLQCGTHAPRFYELRGEVPPPPPYSPLAHNCSGKHSGMLAYCVQCGLPKESYLAFDHPLQQAIRRAVAHFTSTPEAELVAGIDGCSAPNYAVPLDRLALGVRAARGAPTTTPCTARAPQVAGRRDDRAPGNGVGRAAQRPRADARRARRLGGQDRRRRRAGASASAAAGIGHRDQGRRRQQARLQPAPSRCWSSWAARRDRAELADWRSRGPNYRGIVTGHPPSLSWTNRQASAIA